MMRSSFASLQKKHFFSSFSFFKELLNIASWPESTILEAYILGQAGFNNNYRKTANNVNRLLHLAVQLAHVE